MNRYEKAFSNAQRIIANAANAVAEGYARGRYPDEVAITGNLAGRIEAGLNGYASGGILWQVKTLSPYTEEKPYGADFMGILTLALPDFSVTKGFLAQSKRQESGQKLDASEWKRLQSQCEKMLARTPASFVFVYARNGIVVVPAISVLASTGREDLHTLHPKKVQNFFREHFECYIGDRKIDQPSLRALDLPPARFALVVEGAASDRTGLFENEF